MRPSGIRNLKSHLREFVGRYAALIETGIIRRALESGDPLENWPSAHQVRLPAGTAASLVDQDRS